MNHSISSPNDFTYKIRNMLHNFFIWFVKQECLTEGGGVSLVGSSGTKFFVLCKNVHGSCVPAMQLCLCIYVSSGNWISKCE
jgi:hypothetical protein